MNRELDQRIKAHRQEGRDLCALIAAITDDARRREAVLAMYGYRNTRARRAPSNTRLRRPNKHDLQWARVMLKGNIPKHEIESVLRRAGVRVTRNTLSQLEGARP